VERAIGDFEAAGEGEWPPMRMRWTWKAG